MPSYSRPAWCTVGPEIREELTLLTLVIPRTVPEPQSSKQTIREVCGALPFTKALWSVEFAELREQDHDP